MPFTTSVFAQTGKFTEITPIGRGAAGQVYVARDNLQRLVAVKEALPTTKGFASIRTKFEKESRLQASLKHPNIVSVYHLEEDPQTHELYLVCEYASAGSLAERLEQRGPLPPAEALAFALDICAALEETQHQQVVHRDIKPSNILLVSDDQERFTAKLGDFGIAQDRRLRRTTILPGTTHPGTPLYMAPEQADATALLDTRTDIYALGMTLWQMLTGEDYKVLLRDTDRPDIRAYNPHANPDIGRIVQQAVRPDPAERYQTPQELRADLERVRDGKRPTATRTPRRSCQRTRPHHARTTIPRWVFLTIAGVMSALIVLLAYQTFTQAQVDAWLQRPPSAVGLTPPAQPVPTITRGPITGTTDPQQRTIALNTEVMDTLADVTTVHSWTFSGQAGQVITITAAAPKNIPGSTVRSFWPDAPLVPARSADPRLRLLGPDGTELAFNDDARSGTSNPVDAQIDAFELLQDGTYTIVVDTLIPGTYVLSLADSGA